MFEEYEEQNDDMTYELSEKGRKQCAEFVTALLENGYDLDSGNPETNWKAVDFLVLNGYAVDEQNRPMEPMTVAVMLTPAIQIWDRIKEATQPIIDEMREYGDIPRNTEIEE